MPDVLTPYYALTKMGFNEHVDNWDVPTNANLDKIDAGLHAHDLLIAQGAPTGMLAEFDLAAAPVGWVVHDGSTIGDALSGANRANADTAALFTAMWAFSNALRPILNSDGTVGARGLTAAADYAAHKRLPVGNSTNRVTRALGADAPLLGAVQEDAMQRIQGAIGNVIKFNSGSYNPSGALAAGATLGQHPGTDNGVFDIAPVTFDSNTSAGAKTNATETRVKAYGVLRCIKL